MTSARIDIRGASFAALAALLWGFVPVYICPIDDVNAIEIVMHRARWSGAILLLVMLPLPKLMGGTASAREALRVPCLRRCFLASCTMLTINWMIFVHAVQLRQLIEAALCYFIYPLFTVALGILFFRERLDRWAWVAVAIFAAGVVVKAADIGGIPWIAVIIAVSFGFYVLIRKRMGVDVVTGCLSRRPCWCRSASGIYGGWLRTVSRSSLTAVRSMWPLRCSRV